MRVKVLTYSSNFAGDKDAAAEIRDTLLRPSLGNSEPVVLDFNGVDLATQSFVHALLAATIRDDPTILEQITFVNCNPNITSIIEIVVDYAQQDLDSIGIEEDLGESK